MILSFPLLFIFLLIFSKFNLSFSKLNFTFLFLYFITYKKSGIMLILNSIKWVKIFNIHGYTHTHIYVCMYVCMYVKEKKFIKK